MANQTKTAKDLYDEGMAEVYRIVGSLDSTAKQVRVAKQTAKDLSSMLAANTLASVEGRTAILAGLIVELNQVIDSVQTKPPYADALNNLNGILKNVNKLYTKEKKALP